MGEKDGGATSPFALLSVLLERMEERQAVMQNAFYKNSSQVNEIRAMILLDLTVVLRDTINDYTEASTDIGGRVAP